MPHTEAWLRGPVDGIDPLLMPAAHALIEARENLEELLPEFATADLWARPGGAASLGFHLRHLAGAHDRLHTYARGSTLDATQKEALTKESVDRDDSVDARTLVADAQAGIDRALEQLRQTRAESVLDARQVGRAALPSNVLGLLFHAAEHTSRHVGQIITTLNVQGGTKPTNTSPV